MTKNKGFAITLMVLGYLVLVFSICFVAVALVHAYPAWALLIYAGEFIPLAIFGYIIPAAFRALR